MGKNLKTALCFLATAGLLVTNVAAQDKRFEAQGEVTSVDPAVSRVTIQHKAIKGFSGDAETEFTVSDPALLAKIEKRDLVNFTVVDKRGDTRIEKIEKTGQAPPEEEMTMGQVVQHVLVGTGEIAKGVTAPIPPAHEVMSGAVGATTDATGSVLDNVDTKVKNKF